ncbi:MAG TPA: DNA polymerase III subunit beta [Gammaproteobacteria bacterium]|nr:DNA polymerase III subunit beta [Gammaproteobacteria bacterium]
MKFEIEREEFLKPLQAVIGVVEKRQTMPVLSNMLVAVRDDRLSVTATDLEVELVARAGLEGSSPGAVTVPGRKLVDIVRTLPEGAGVSVELEGERVTVRSGRSRFTLSTLPAAEFPAIEELHGLLGLDVSQASLKRLCGQTAFAMAHQDVRYYLNGLLMEFRPEGLRAVGTDGHRLALCDVECTTGAGESEPRQVIVPRKGVVELQRLLGDDDQPARLEVSTNHVRVTLGDLRFTSKVIDGRFPDYERVIPRDGDKRVQVDRQVLRQALARTAILSNEKYRGIRLQLDSRRLAIQAHNPEQESAEEELEVSYEGDGMEVGFNVNYLLDPLAALEGEAVELVLKDSNSSCLIQAPGDESSRHVVMPMRL